MDVIVVDVIGELAGPEGDTDLVDNVQSPLNKPDKLCLFSGLYHGARPPYWLSLPDS